MVREGLINRSKRINEVCEPMVIISDGIITLSKSGQLIVKTHGSGTRLSGEHALKGGPNFTRCGALDHVGENFFG